MAAVAPLRAVLSQPREALAPIWRTGDGAYVNALIAPDARARRVPAAALTGALAEALIVPLLPALDGASSLIVAAEGPLGRRFRSTRWTLRGEPLGARFRRSPAPSLSLLLGERAAQAVARALHARSRRDRPRRLRRDDARCRRPLRAARTVECRYRGAAAEVGVGPPRWFPPKRRMVIAGDDASKARLIALARDGTLAHARYVHVARARRARRRSRRLVVDRWVLSLLDVANRSQRARLSQPPAERKSRTFTIGADMGRAVGVRRTALGKEGSLAKDCSACRTRSAVAGARETLLTLWPVADAPTAAFMRRFYLKLARGASPADALARTKREGCSYVRKNFRRRSTGRRLYCTGPDDSATAGSGAAPRA